MLGGDCSLASPIAAFHPTKGLLTMSQIIVEGVKVVETITHDVPQNDYHDISNLMNQTEEDKQVDGKSKGIPTKESERLVPNENQIIVHGAHGKYLMDKCK